MNNNRIYISKDNIKVIAVNEDGSHCELNFDYRTIQSYSDTGWNVYASNNEGVFFFLNNRNEDGFDWCKITKKDNIL